MPTYIIISCYAMLCYGMLPTWPYSMVSSDLKIYNGSSFRDEISQSAELSSFTVDPIVYRSESNNGGESIIGM
jgi:hypothetical protein